MTPEQRKALHALVTKALIERIVVDDLSAADIATYFQEAAVGMNTCAAFKLRGTRLAIVLREDLKR